MPRSRSLYAECLAIFKGLGDRTGVAWSLNYQGDVARDQGDSTAARALYEQGLAIFRDLGDRGGIAGTLADLGSLAREQGNYPQRDLCTGKHKNFPGAGPQARNCAPAGVFRVLSGCRNSKQSVRCDWRAQRPRCAKIWRSAHAAEQAKLEAGLHPARQALTNTAGEAAWLEGWALPAEKAIEKVLTPELRLARVSAKEPGWLTRCGESNPDAGKVSALTSHLWGRSVVVRRRRGWRECLRAGMLRMAASSGANRRSRPCRGYVAMEPLIAGPLPRER